MAKSERSNGFDSTSLRAQIESAAESVGRVWPLYADVAANPLSGFEDRPFREAVAEGERLFGGRGYPTAAQFRDAWERGRIDPKALGEVLDRNGVREDPEELLDRLEALERDGGADARYDETVNRILSKWLAAFLEQGQAAWSMPNREAGFYAAWRELARYDRQIPESSTPVGTYYRERLNDLPETASEAIYAVLSGQPEDDWEDVFEYQLAALPGWVGFIRQRAADDNNPWQEKYPVTLTDYLAVRLTLATHAGVDVEPDYPEADPEREDRLFLADLWLTAWRESYRRDLVDDVRRGLDDSDEGGDGPAEAQLVFCIDTRSEILRRHLERTGPYETRGYAGFFGVPIEYSGYRSKTQTESCPVMVDPKHHVTERPKPDRDRGATLYERWDRLATGGRKLMKSLKNDLAAAFGFVEASGSLFGTALASRTLFPGRVRDLSETVGAPDPAEFCEPTVDDESDEASKTGLSTGISTEQKAFYAEAAFDLTCWEEFAPVVAFVGHESETVNNPYESSIDCGACAGSPGVPNARVLAEICNDPEVRSVLRDRGIDVPSDTVFVAGRHNTTTDEVTLVVDAELSDRQRATIAELRDDLERAQAGAAEERLEAMDVSADDGVRETEKRTSDWAEPRPEIGLSGNAGFFIGPRSSTSGVDLDGRCFLHSYDWRRDPDGDALENIVSGPVVVAQMISAQYYFSTVDNDVYGSGSKTTHNTVGNLGVIQGNGGDLMTGLPLQSLYSDDRRPYHQPLPLSVVIHAPVETMTDILSRNEHVSELFDNGWMGLTVIDPQQDDACLRYLGELEWERTDAATSAEEPAPRPVERESV